MVTILHIPVLLIATLLTFGGTVPYFNPAYAIREFGLPARISDSPASHPIIMYGGARTSALGMLLFVFYSQNQLAAVDTVLTVMIYVGLADGYICWREGVPAKGVVRATAGLIIGTWGMLGLTSRFS